MKTALLQCSLVTICVLLTYAWGNAIKEIGLKEIDPTHVVSESQSKARPIRIAKSDLETNGLSAQDAAMKKAEKKIAGFWRNFGKPLSTTNTEEEDEAGEVETNINREVDEELVLQQPQSEKSGEAIIEGNPTLDQETNFESEDAQIVKEEKEELESSFRAGTTHDDFAGEQIYYPPNRELPQEPIPSPQQPYFPTPSYPNLYNPIGMPPQMPMPLPPQQPNMPPPSYGHPPYPSDYRPQFYLPTRDYFRGAAYPPPIYQTPQLPLLRNQPGYSQQPYYLAPPRSNPFSQQQLMLQQQPNKFQQGGNGNFDQYGRMTPLPSQ